jgi:methyl-accepting chemotaxis protein
MKFLQNLKIRHQLMLLVLPLGIALILLTAIFYFQTNYVNNRLTSSLHDEAFVSTAAIINADRDFYQALVAEMAYTAMGPDATKDDRDGLIATYEENATQAYDRIKLAMDNLRDNPALFKEYQHAATGQTLEQAEKVFFENFDQ